MNRHERHRKNAFAEKISVTVALSLALGKGVIGFFSGSLALLASAIDSILDSVVSLVNFFTLRAAAKPADKDHPFGHGKFEAFSEFFQGLLISFSGLFLAVESVRRLFSPQEIGMQSVALGVMLASVLITFLLVRYLRSVAKQTNSLIIKADSVHYESDLLSNIAIIGGLLLVKFFGLLFIDALLSLVISFLILKSAFGLLRESFSILTDHEIFSEERKKIEYILNNAKAPITSWHFLRTRRSGSQVHIDFHLVFNDTISLLDAHTAADEVERKIIEVLPNAVILTHLDPHDDSNANIEMMKEVI